MSVIFPFAAVRPEPSVAVQVAAPPYDVMSAAEAATLAADNPLSFLRVSRAEIELPPGADIDSEAVYLQAAANYRRLKQQAPLRQETAPRLYIYTLVMGEQRQTGMVAACAIDEYDAGTIKKHEKTRRDKEDDRTRHILSLRSQTGPVFLTYRENAGVDAIVAALQAENAPLYDFVAADGIRHTVWRVPEAQARRIQALFAAEVPALYIADGHHRAASASRVREFCRQQNPGHTGNEEYNRVLGVIFPANQLRILPYNRVIKDLNGLTAAEFLKKCAAHFTMVPTAAPTPAGPGQICAYLSGTWSLWTYTGSSAGLPPTEQLDVSLLQNLVLAPILGIDDPRTSKRLDFVGGIRGTRELEERVNRGEAQLAFSMYPTTVAQLMAIADAGGIMPPKSTWFEPKLRDGLLIHDI